jgi:hypothetical protein
MGAQATVKATGSREDGKLTLAELIDFVRLCEKLEVPGDSLLKCDYSMSGILKTITIA